MDKSSTYCVMPHLGMALQNHADLCVCNTNKLSWKDKNKQVIHVHTHSIDKAYQSHTRKIIAAALDHGIKHASCGVCWDLESAGAISLRSRFNKMFGDLQPWPDQPRVLIIKPGNTCNFACRMCNPVTSSSWYADGYELERSNLVSSSWYDDEHAGLAQAVSFNEYTREFENVRNSFNRDNEQFWNCLKGWMAGLTFIDIYGGEPFLTPAMFDLLEHGVQIGASRHITVNVSTNASIFNQKYMDILSHYKKVQFSVSVDSDHPAQLEYIRHKAKFDVILDNCQKFKKIIAESPNINMSVTCTITPFNVYYLNTILPGIRKMFDLPVSMNIVTTPEYDIRHLPPAAKSKCISTLTEPTVKNFLQQTIPGCDTEWPKFCRITDKLDQLRGQSFAETFPEWWTVLEPYWIKT